MEQAELITMLRDALKNGVRAFTNATNIVDGLQPGQAETRLPGSPYSITDLVAHMVFWQDRLVGALQSGVFGPGAEHATDGWPQASWPDVAQRFLAGLERLDALSGDCEALARRFGVESGASLINGMALHNAHHLGQIVALRRLAGAWPPPGGGETW